MPGPFGERHVLDHVAVAAHEQVRRDFEAPDPSEIRVRIEVV